MLSEIPLACRVLWDKPVKLLTLYFSYSYLGDIAGSVS